MPVPAHRHRETFSHLIGSYGNILYGRVANPLYIDVRLVAHGQVPLALVKLSTVSVNEGKKRLVKSGKDTYAAPNQHLHHQGR